MNFIQVKIHLWSSWTISPRLISLHNVRAFISKALKVSLYFLINEGERSDGKELEKKKN